MKAVQINQYGAVEVLEINQNASRPVPSKNQILVEIHAASINPVDWKIRQGFFKDMAPLQFPATLGGDFAGIVKEVGEEVSEFKIGDEVFGSAIVLNGGSGSFAQEAIVNTKNVALKPKNIDFIKASALPLVGSSAVQALEEHIKLQKDPASAKAMAGKQKILIHGGMGGIGHIAIQLAKAIGAYVATTVSTQDVDYAKQLGADEIIDYTQEKFEQKLKDFDAVFDTVGGDVTDNSFTVLKRGGILVSMAGEPNQEKAKELGITAISQFTNTNTSHLQRVKELIESGKIKVSVDKVFSLEQAKEAFSYQEQVHPKGKVVFKIKS